MNFVITRKRITVLTPDMMVKNYLVGQEEIERIKEEIPSALINEKGTCDVIITQKEFNQMLKDFLISKGVRF